MLPGAVSGAGRLSQRACPLLVLELHREARAGLPGRRERTSLRPRRRVLLHAVPNFSPLFAGHPGKPLRPLQRLYKPLQDFHLASPLLPGPPGWRGLRSFSHFFFPLSTGKFAGVVWFVFVLMPHYFLRNSASSVTGHGLVFPCRRRSSLLGNSIVFRVSRILRYKHLARSSEVRSVGGMERVVFEFMSR